MKIHAYRLGCGIGLIAAPFKIDWAHHSLASFSLGGPLFAAFGVIFVLSSFQKSPRHARSTPSGRDSGPADSR